MFREPSIASAPPGSERQPLQVVGEVIVPARLPRKPDPRPRRRLQQFLGRPEGVALMGRYGGVAMSACVVFFLVVESTVTLGDPFADELQFLDEQYVQDVGREPVIAGYERLLKDYPDHPRRAEVMLRIASLWEVTVPELKLVPDYEKAVEWTQRAVQAAPKGRESWLEGQFLLSARTRDENPDEARRILCEIARLAFDPVVEIKVLYDLQMIEVREGNLAEAEELCVRIQRWTQDPARMPERMFDKGRIFFVQQASASSMMEVWLYLDAPHERRLQKMQGIVDVLPTEYNQQLLEEMKARLSQMKDKNIQPGPLASWNDRIALGLASLRISGN